MAVQSRVAVPRALVTNFALSWPLLAIVIATILRFVLMLVPSHGYDSFAYKHWTWRLVHEPLSRFYIDDGQAFPDHLPGDLWLFKLLGSGFRFINPDIDLYGPIYGAAISLMATTFDASLAFVLIAVGAFIGRERAGLFAALAYWCSPAPIFVASVWGQIDAIATTFAVIVLMLAIAGRFSWAFVVLTLCVLVKPQFALLVLPLLAGWWRAEFGLSPRWVLRVGSTAGLCVGLLAVISAPFGVSLIGGWGEWSLLERVQMASDTYTVSVLGAHNLWILFDPFTWPPDDRTPWLFGVSRHAVGILLLFLVIAYTGWLLIARWRGAITMVLASNVLMFGFFLVMTRMHERYLFPVVALSLLMALMDSHYARYAVSVNILVFLNIALRFIWPRNNEWESWQQTLSLETDWFVQLLATLTAIVFGWLIIEGARRNSH